jgi:L,D-transpeptidase ErfK/SrfK
MILILSFSVMPGPLLSLAGGGFSYSMPAAGNPVDVNAQTVIGFPQKHTIKKKETLLDVARDYDLGINELKDLYPELDPWIPPEGMELTLPSRWVLPDTRLEEIVINIPELRLYLFSKRTRMVRTFPVGIGDEEWNTPVGLFAVQDKREKPIWYIPPSLQEKYGMKTMPPGPENPLGDHWIGIGKSYGIHGTDIPWSVGHLVTHGCIRLYPEDISLVYNLVSTGTRVEIIYEPVKIGFVSGKIFVEVHKDIYNKIGDLYDHAYRKLEEKKLTGMVDMERFREAMERRDGLPVEIGLGSGGNGDAPAGGA